MTVDRRSLSQARYDALHLHAEPQPASRGAHAVWMGARTWAARSAPSQPAVAGAQTATVTLGALRRRSAASVERPPGRLFERRAPASALARTILSRVQNEPRPGAHFTLTLPQGRVYVHVRREHGALRLIALCPPAARAAVDAALAHVRFALAGNGFALAW